MDDASLLDDQRAYYRARASEYNEWWERTGRFDRGPDANARWFEEAAILRNALERFGARGDVLELACGTGIWTERLATTARRVVAVDASPEMIRINRARVDAANVEYVQADLFDFSPPGDFDVCFFGFWLSHVPESRFARFWATMQGALRPGGRVFFVDSARTERSTAADHVLPRPDEETMMRKLNDGRAFRVVKRFYEPEDLCDRLGVLGWAAQVQRTSEFFIFGSAAAGN